MNIPARIAAQLYPSAPSRATRLAPGPARGLSTDPNPESTGAARRGSPATTPAEGADQVQPGVEVKTLDAALEREAPAPEGEAPPAERAEARVSRGVKVKTLDAAIPEDK